MSEPIRVIDSHTGGEPTRIVVAGVPDLGGGTVRRQMDVFNDQHDALRRSLVNEPRGWDAMVGGLLVPTVEAGCSHGIIFFNNVGSLWMCVHGTIGLAVTLGYLEQVGFGKQTIETPVGEVEFNLVDDNTVEVVNVPGFRYRKAVTVNVAGTGSVTGDIAWGGNWFFLVNDHSLEIDLANVRQLTDFTLRIRQSLCDQQITGDEGAEIDHIELFSPTENTHTDSKNFVLCPGGEYDRSPCGTGTSAKLACLLEDEVIAPGEIWRQESIAGSVFEVHGEWVAQGARKTCLPTIRGTAFITADAEMVMQEKDPFRDGIQG